MTSSSILGGPKQPWTGAPMTLNPNDGATLSPTTNGNMVIALFNTDTKNNRGQVILTHGGAPPEVVDVEALQNAPVMLVRDYDGDTLTVTNISQQAPVWIAAYGPGLPSANPSPLPDNGQFQPLGFYQVRTTMTATTYQRLVFHAEASYSVFALFIGPKVTTLAINAPGSVPAGSYDVVSSANSYPVTNNWLGQTLWVINLSPSTSQGGQVSLTSL